MDISKTKTYKSISHIYRRFLKALDPLFVPIQIMYYRIKQKEAVKRKKNKYPLRCAFLVIDDSIWKCDAIYRHMEMDEHFDPMIIVCPIVNRGREFMLEKMQSCYNMFKSKGYNVIKSYNQLTDEYIEFKEFDIDILFYTNPYKGLIDNRYYVNKYKDILTVYIPYYINGTNDNEMAYNQPIHNLCWRYYVESPIHKYLAEKFSFAKGKNVVISGYPGIEDFINPDYIPTDSWKVKENKLKRIIWAPHQSIEISGSVNYSTFLQYAEFMLEMAEKYKEKVQFAFKPHPLLKNRLYAKWGKEKTDAYYQRWNSMPNTMISDSDYHDLFITSDALIHDCGSFTIEYLYLDKPVMRLMNGLDPKSMFGDFGMACISQHYLAYKREDIENFIVNVINNKDSKHEERRDFIKSNLYSEILPSKLIINDILKSIN